MRDVDDSLLLPKVAGDWPLDRLLNADPPPGLWPELPAAVIIDNRVRCCMTATGEGTAMTDAAASGVMRAMVPAERRRQQLQGELDRVIPIVIDQLHPQCIIAFGSFAQRRVTEWSDLDLVIVADTDLPFYQRLDRVYRSVEPQVGLDVLVYTPAEWADLVANRRFVQEEILQKGRVLYERSG